MLTTPKSLERLGQKNKMRCGLIATIIKYNSANDIDIQFEDGVVVKNKSYDCFNKGKIQHPILKRSVGEYKTRNKKQDRIGETKMMSCGMVATIIEYREIHNIDVEFEDGTIVKNKGYGEFKKGGIKNPNLKQKNNSKTMLKKYKPHREGEVAVMNNGMSAKIICYRNAKDIDVMFDDGYISKNTTYRNFQLKTIGNPNLGKKGIRIKKIKHKYIGLKNTMNCQKNATIIEYHNNKNVDIIFDDGEIKKCSFESFKSGNVGHPNLKGYIAGSSKGEKAIGDILNKNNIDFISQKKFEDCRGLPTKSYTKGVFMPYDFYLPQYNMLIEYQGEFHDGTVTKKNPDFFSVEKYERLKERDEYKRNYAKNNNIKLLEIWYYDFNNIENILRKELNIC